MSCILTDGPESPVRAHRQLPDSRRIVRPRRVGQSSCRSTLPNALRGSASTKRTRARLLVRREVTRRVREQLGLRRWLARRRRPPPPPPHPTRRTAPPPPRPRHTAGCASRTSSTSRGYTLKPPEMMSSLARPTMLRYPSASSSPTSPLRNQPSVNAARVAASAAPVAGEHVRPAEQDLSRVVAVLAGVEAHVHTGQREADGPGAPLAVVGIGDVHDRLGHAVALQHAHAARASPAARAATRAAAPSRRRRGGARRARRPAATPPGVRTWSARRRRGSRRARARRRAPRRRRTAGAAPRSRRRAGCRAARRRGRGRGTAGAPAPGDRARPNARPAAAPRSSPACCRG